MLQTLEISDKIKNLYELASPCRLCPRQCSVKRKNGEQGFCKSDMRIFISSTGPHYGEEPPISGTRGSGTIFFSHCSMECKFCQNYPISQLLNGYEVSVEKLSDIMIDQQKRGCHNVNLVTPTQYAPQITQSIEIARKRGLEIPIVYNCSGYESVETLKLLKGFIDIYLPDSKYDSNEQALINSNVRKYVDYNRLALLEMHSQVGLLKQVNGIAQKGLIIRHLILPEGRAGTKNVLDWIAKNLPGVYLSLMSQYFPAYKAINEPGLNRKITKEEYDEAVCYLEETNIVNGWIQSFED